MAVTRGRGADRGRLAFGGGEARAAPPPMPMPAPPHAPMPAPWPVPTAGSVPADSFGFRTPVVEATPVPKVDPRAAGVRWWTAAYTAWSEWKSSGVALAYALRGTVAEYPHLLSVPIRESAEQDQGRLAAGYFLLLEHGANQSPSFGQTAVARAISQVGAAGAPAARGGNVSALS